MRSSPTTGDGPGVEEAAEPGSSRDRARPDGTATTPNRTSPATTIGAAPPRLRRGRSSVLAALDEGGFFLQRHGRQVLLGSSLLLIPVVASTVIAIVALRGASESTTQTVFSFMFFAAIFAYPILFETFMRGRTPGTIVIRDPRRYVPAPAWWVSPPFGLEQLAEAIDPTAITVAQYAVVRSFLTRVNTLAPHVRFGRANDFSDRLAAVIGSQRPPDVPPEAFLLCAISQYQRTAAGPAPHPFAPVTG